MNKILAWVVWAVLLYLMIFGISVFDEIDNLFLSAAHFVLPISAYTWFSMCFSKYMFGKN